MTIILPNSAFLHIPKTGGTWVRNALDRAGLNKREILSALPSESTEAIVRSWHNVPLHDEEFTNCENVFCFVRNPFTWYQSYWAYKVGGDKWQKASLIDGCASNNFNTFVDNVLEEFPKGYVTWLYDFYTPYASFIGKMEQLQGDLVRALTIFGEQFKLDDLSGTKRAKVSSGKIKAKAIYKSQQITRLYTAEQKAINKYGYNRAMSFLRFV